MRMYALSICPIVLMTGLLATSAVSQTMSPVAEPDQTTISGTIISSSRSSITVRTESDSYQLFVFDSNTIRPAAIPKGAIVTVISVPTSDPRLRLARSVVVAGSPGSQKPAPPTAKPAEPQPVLPAEPQPSAQSTEPADPVQSPGPVHQAAPPPAWTRELERDIERHTSNFGFGFRAGVGLDPEVIMTGVHARLGPIFNRNVSFRPSVEGGFGEVTKMFAVNLDMAYRLPLTPHWSSWSVYLAGGPSLGYSSQNFGRGGSTNWSNLEFTPALNIGMGLEFRNGFLMETRATPYASPNPSFRLMFGYSF